MFLFCLKLMISWYIVSLADTVPPDEFIRMITPTTSESDSAFRNTSLKRAAFDGFVLSCRPLVSSLKEIMPSRSTRSILGVPLPSSTFSSSGFVEGISDTLINEHPDRQNKTIIAVKTVLFICNSFDDAIRNTNRHV